MNRFSAVMLLLVGLLAACQVTVVTEPDPSVSVSPEEVTLAPEAAQVFTANVENAEGATVVWTTPDGGGFSSTDGENAITFTAPSEAGEYRVVATIPDATATATVTVIEPLEAGDDFTMPIEEDITLAAGETASYLIEVPDNLTEALLYFELVLTGGNGEDLLLNVDDAFYSNNEALFSTAVPTQSSSLSTQGIRINRACGGPCVVITNEEVAFHTVEITNRAVNGSVTFNLFAYTSDFQDTGEPENDNCAGVSTSSIVITPQQPDQGAIETIGDVDCYENGAAAETVTVSGGEDLAIELDIAIYDVMRPGEAARAEFTIGPGDQPVTFSEVSQETVVVVVQASEAVAGPPATANYRVEFDAEPVGND